MIREVIVLAGVLIRWHRKVVLKKYVSKRFGCFCHKYVKFAYFIVVVFIPFLFTVIQVSPVF